MRAFATAVHRWAGLAVALFLVVSGLTGAVISWDHEIDGWLNRKLYDTASRGPFRDPFDLVAAVEAHDPRARVAYLPLGFEEGHTARYFVQPRTDPATGKPFRLGYNQVFVDPVTAEVRGRRDASAISLKPETLMPFLRKLHYMLHVPAVWGTDRLGYWIMGGVALVWLLDSCVALYLTTPRRQRRAAHPEHRGPREWWKRWKPAWAVRWAAGGYRLNFDLHRAGGLWMWALIIVIAFTSFSLNLYKEIFHPMLSLVSKTTPGPSALVPLAPLGTRIEPTIGFRQIVADAEAEARRRGWTTPLGGVFYNQRGGFYNVSFFDHATHDSSDGMGLSNLYLDGRDGRVISSNRPWHGTAADVFAQLQLPLHGGRILGLPGRILMSLMGLAVAGLSITGIVIWWRKRRARLVQVRRQRELAPKELSAVRPDALQAHR
ncbi:PepSY-associated TM helix domain-containing protein [Variovorax sp. V59]|uniref:Putative iron-regulated membrane protein n=1 Tax=Variovorax beijingensis TaxID=2496117 RepID=A0A561C842_9BURK|nr:MULTISPECIES: PepSY-associated TM helix domain-containing protein [Variovorax]MBD9664589.1 PepSY domain-containing protein [Variovorax sp. VRV01]TWD87365.1 putative iron-regulated membrane protein [Variovorax beijingensis]